MIIIINIGIQNPWYSGPKCGCHNKWKICILLGSCDITRSVVKAKREITIEGIEIINKNNLFRIILSFLTKLNVNNMNKGHNGVVITKKIPDQNVASIVLLLAAARKLGNPFKIQIPKNIKYILFNV